MWVDVDSDRFSDQIDNNFDQLNDKQVKLFHAIERLF